MQRPFFLFLFFIAFTANASAAAPHILTPALFPGQTVIVQFDEAPSRILFDAQLITAFPYRSEWRAAIPVPRSAHAGAHQLTMQVATTTIDRTVSVRRGRARTITFPVPKKLGITARELTKNLSTANNVINTSTAAVSETTRFSEPFGLPLKDNRMISSRFGEVRTTGSERIVHLGTDFAARKGSAVGAINAGVVVNAYADPVYGNSVIVDHGRGTYSLYLHLDTMRVTFGDSLKKGSVIGTVGDSGLASAPHLHLSVKINGISVDPLQFISAFR